MKRWSAAYWIVFALSLALPLVMGLSEMNRDIRLGADLAGDELVAQLWNSWFSLGSIIIIPTLLLYAVFSWLVYREPSWTAIGLGVLAISLIAAFGWINTLPVVGVFVGLCFSSFYYHHLKHSLSFGILIVLLVVLMSMYSRTLIGYKMLAQAQAAYEGITSQQISDPHQALQICEHNTRPVIFALTRNKNLGEFQEQCLEAAAAVANDPALCEGMQPVPVFYNACLYHAHKGRSQPERIAACDQAVPLRDDLDPKTSLRNDQMELRDKCVLRIAQELRDVNVCNSIPRNRVSYAYTASTVNLPASQREPNETLIKNFAYEACEQAACGYDKSCGTKQ